jgi:hypothetical protein
MPLIIFTLLSCDKKGTPEINQPSLGQLESSFKAKDSIPDNRLLGEWTVQLSCDGSIMCNQCREISFRADGFVTITNPVKTFEVMKWEINEDKLKITNITSEGIVDTGDYSMTYKMDKNTIGLELIGSTNSHCYKFTRLISNSANKSYN